MDIKNHSQEVKEFQQDTKDLQGFSTLRWTLHKVFTLPLRELEASARLRLAVFLALDNTRVAGEKPALL